MMNILDGIEEFVLVIEKGTFSSAAKVLGVSTSHVSRQINLLEERLGVQLIKRSTRSMNLTETGEVYFQNCSEIVEKLRSTNEQITGEIMKPRGLIRITAARGFPEIHIVPLLVDFMSEYPDIQVDLDFNKHLVDMIQEGYDLAIRYGYLKDSSLIARKLTERKLSICGSPDYFEKHGIPMTPSDLKQHNCLVGNSPYWRLRVPGGIRNISVSGNWRCSDSGYALASAACKGLGLVYLSTFYINEPVEKGLLVPVLQDFIVDDVATWLVYPNKRYLPNRVRLLINFLTSHFEKTT